MHPHPLTPLPTHPPTHPLTSLAFFLTLLTLASSLHASPENARIPYQLIYQIQRKQAVFALTYTNLHIFLRMKSTLPNVNTTNLNVYIDTKDGHLPIPLAADGQFSVPMRDTLVAEEAYIVVNQPKGSMKLEWYVGLESELPTNGIRYRDCLRPIKDVEAIRDQMIPGSPSLAVGGLKMIFPKDKNGTVTIHAKAGDRHFKANSDHELTIPMDPALMDENPILTIPIPPEKVDVAEAPPEK